MTNDVINNLCEKFGVTVECLMPKMITYYRVSSVMSFIISLLILIVGVVMVVLAVKDARKKDETIDDNPWRLLAFVFGISFVVCGAIAFMVTAANTAETFIAPEAYVIQKLISELR